MRIRALGCGMLLLAGACAEASPSASADEADVVTKAAPLEESDFAAPLDKALLRGTNANLTDAAFAQKWTASHASALMFLRAYPGGYHKDLAQVAVRRIPGREGLCFGDAHLENFGFLALDGRTSFVFNDLDDSGYCLVALDAARYLASVRLAYDDRDIDERVLEQYVDTLKDASRAKTVKRDLVPDLKAERSKRVDEATQGNVLRLIDGLAPCSPQDRAAIEHLFQSTPSLAAVTLLDVATLPRDSGGSGGLRRYHALVDGPGGRTILELKESAAPGTDLGRHTKTLAMASRLDTLESAFWGQQTDDYFYVTLDTRFLVRDRVAKKSLTFDDLSKSDRLDVLLVEASQLALLHANALESVTKDDMRSWLAGTTKVIARRWKTAMTLP